jgi:TRAP-type transport system periplasmic protein
MKKRFVLFWMLALSFFLITTGISGTALAEKKLRLVTPAPAGDWPLAFLSFELAKRFNARVSDYQIEVYAGGALAKLPEYFDAVRVGAVEMSCAPWPMFSNLDARLGVIETPFLFVSSSATSSATMALLPLYDQVLQEKFNAKGLSMFTTGGMNLFSTKPVKTLEDWKGLLTGALSPSAAALAKTLGASPVTIMWTETYEALQKNVIVSTLQSTHGAVAMNMIDVAKYATIFYGISLANGFGINLDVWKKMPKNVQDILQEEAMTSAKWMNDLINGELGDMDLKSFKERGVTAYFVPKAERARWESLAAPLKEKQLSIVGEFGQKVKQIAEKANEAYPYTEGQVE